MYRFFNSFPCDPNKNQRIKKALVETVKLHRAFCRKRASQLFLQLVRLGIKSCLTLGTLDSFFQFIGKYFPFFAARRTFDLHLTQRFVGFKPRTMLI
jgi:hypothetical protein